MRGRKPVSVVLLAAVAAMVCAASSASATVVTSDAGGIIAESGNATFRFENAMSEAFVTCTESSLSLGVPAEEGVQGNANQGPSPTFRGEGPTGTYSNRSGAVGLVVSDPPSFGECSLGVPGEKDLLSATVSGGEGAWAASAYSVDQPSQEELNVVALGIPQEGLTISIDSAECTVLLAPDSPDSGWADYSSRTEAEEGPGVLEVDSQIHYEVQTPVACAALGISSESSAVSQFEGTYSGEGGEELVIQP